jgi:hypothetical protein
MAATGRHRLKAVRSIRPIGLAAARRSPVSESVPGPTSGEVDLLFALVRERYGRRLTPEELEAVRAGVAAIVEGARALRAVRLDNADGPALPPPLDLPPAP